MGIVKRLGGALFISGVLIGAAGEGRAAAADETATARYAKPTGARQCEAVGNRARDLQAAVEQLKAQGVTVKSASCGHDGLMRVALCGAATGDLFIVEVQGVSDARMRQASYSPMRDWPQAREMPCAPD